jgi:hypothetical protein
MTPPNVIRPPFILAVFDPSHSQTLGETRPPRATVTQHHGTFADPGTPGHFVGFFDNQNPVSLFNGCTKTLNSTQYLPGNTYPMLVP